MRIARIFIALALIAAASAASAADRLRVGTPAPAFPFFPVNIGIAKGFFAAHGIEVELYTLSGGGKLMQAAAAGSLDIVVGSGSDFAYMLKGVPITGVAAMAGPPNLFGVIIGAPSPIRTVDDLKGKKIGISTVGAVTHWFALELARQKGWGPDGIEPVALGTGDAPHIAALRTHQVDAVVANSALGFKLEEMHEGRLLIPVGDYVGDCIVHMISASNALIARDPDAVRRFLAGWFDTIAFMRRNKAETVALARAESGFDEAVETREYDLGMPMFSADGNFTAPALATLKSLLVHNHVIAEAADLTPLFTEQFLAKR